MQRLIDIQQRLNAPKNLYNSFGGYAYRSCEGILEAVKPLLNENELTLVLTDTVENIGNFNYIKATATLISSQGDVLKEVSAYAREEESKKGMDASQITGAASSYARKYALNGLFLIDDTKDADATNTHDKAESKSSPKKERSEFSKEATAFKKETNAAIKKAIETGEEVQPKEAPSVKELEDKVKKFDTWFNNLGNKRIINSEIDYVNNFINELEKAGMKVKSIEVREKVNKKLELDDSIPDFGDDN
jgi:hypothetical protein